MVSKLDSEAEDVAVSVRIHVSVGGSVTVEDSVCVASREMLCEWVAELVFDLEREELLVALEVLTGVCDVVDDSVFLVTVS